MMGFPMFARQDVTQAWQEAVEADLPSPRTLYIHIPYCRSHCPFCPFYLKTDTSGESREYVRLLCRELEGAAPDFSGHPINAAYFGGGTPSDLSGRELASLLDAFRKNYHLASDCEITIEGRIDGFDVEKVKLLAARGANRLSIGIQTFDTELRQQLGRQSERSFILRRLEELANLNEMTLVIDLLYALPGQTLDRWSKDLDTLFSCTRLSGLDLYRLKINSGMPLAKTIASGIMPDVPSDKEAYEMFLAGVERMKREGAVRLSPVHFSLDRRERNLNNTVSSSKNVCLQFGMKAVGRLSGQRFHQHRDFELYRADVEAGRKPISEAGTLPDDFAVCGALAGEIYCRMQICPENIARTAPGHLRRSIYHKLNQATQPWVEKKYLFPETKGVYKLTEKANFSHRAMAGDLMENIAGVFL